MLKTQVLSRTDDEIEARVEVTDALKQPLGLVHGGVFATLADQLTSDASTRAISSHTSFLRPITGGHVNATARRRHNGRTTAVWEVDIADDEGRLCALVRITLALETAAGTRS
jgi:1,4-dihydroxy-2-naphthoyl-CoA hydrolase